MDVVLLRWPAEQQRRDALRAVGRPRLLLVEDDALPPLSIDDLEDWIRVPALDVDVRTRVDGLQRRLDALEAVRPVLDEHGVIRVGELWVSLPPVEARITAALLERLGGVVARDTLSRAGWPDGAPGRNALDVHVLRLRRRLEKVGLAIRTVRSRGYLLEQPPSENGQRHAREA